MIYCAEDFEWLFLLATFINAGGFVKSMIVHYHISRDLRSDDNPFKRVTMRPLCLKITQGIITTSLVMATLSTLFYHHYLTCNPVAFFVISCMVAITFFHQMSLSQKVMDRHRRKRTEAE